MRQAMDSLSFATRKFKFSRIPVNGGLIIQHCVSHSGFCTCQQTKINSLVYIVTTDYHLLKIVRFWVILKHTSQIHQQSKSSVHEGHKYCLNGTSDWAHSFISLLCLHDKPDNLDASIVYAFLKTWYVCSLSVKMVLITCMKCKSFCWPSLAGAECWHHTTVFVLLTTRGQYDHD